MAGDNRATPFFEQSIHGAVASTGIHSTSGSRVSVGVPFRGRLIEAGFIPNMVSVTTSITMALAVNTQGSTIGSTYVQAVSSANAQFTDSTLLYEGAVCSVIPATATFVNRGDTIQWTLSGGNSVPAQVYAIIRRG